MPPRNLTPPLKCDRTGRAIVYHASIPNRSKRLVLGKFGTKEAAERYQQFLERLQYGSEEVEIEIGPRTWVTIDEVAIAWDAWARKHYLRNGELGRGYESMRDSINELSRVSGGKYFATFGPKKLADVRDDMARSGRFARKTINAHLGRMKALWKWAVTQELCDVDAYLRLSLVPGLTVGQHNVREAPPVEPASLESIAGVRPYCPPVVADMIVTQFLCLMRPGEVCDMHESGVIQHEDGWLYAPPKHKTQWRSKRLIKAVPESARAIVEARLGGATGYLFDPEEARAWGREQAKLTRGPRKTKLYPCEEKRVYAKQSDRRISGHYTTNGYRTAIARAFERAAKDGKKLEPFTPNQIRHTVVDWVDEQLEQHDAAQLLAGHSSASTTDIYRSKPIKRLRQLASDVEDAFGGL